MNILLYASDVHGSTNANQLDSIAAKFSNARVESIPSLKELKQRLYHLPRAIDVAVLMARDQAQLCELVAIQSFLDGIPLILIIPDFEQETMAKATKLFPSFICTLDSDWEVVGAVIERILRYRYRSSINTGDCKI